MGTFYLDFEFDEVHYITEDAVKVEDGPVSVIGIFNFDSEVDKENNITKNTVSMEDEIVDITKELPKTVFTKNNNSLTTWNMSMARQCSRIVQKDFGHRMDNDLTLVPVRQVQGERPATQRVRPKPQQQEQAYRPWNT